MFSLVPDYTMFGNQHYQHTVDNKTVVTRCSAKEFPDQKVKQSIPDELETHILVPGFLCSLEDLCSPLVVPLQSLDIRSLLLLSYVGLDSLHTLWIFILNLPYEVMEKELELSSSNYIYSRTPTRGIGDQEELIDSDDEDNFHDDIPSNNPFD